MKKYSINVLCNIEKKEGSSIIYGENGSFTIVRGRIHSLYDSRYNIEETETSYKIWRKTSSFVGNIDGNIFTFAYRKADISIKPLDGLFSKDDLISMEAILFNDEPVLMLSYRFRTIDYEIISEQEVTSL